MDILELTKDIQSMKEIVTLYENGLQMFGLKLDDFPDEVKKLLENVIEKQMKGKLHDLDELYINEFYLRRKGDNIRKELSAGKLKAEINDLKKKIQQTKSESSVLERFLNGIDVPEEDFKTNKTFLQARNENLQSKKKALKIPQDFCINELMQKVELLEKMEEKKKPKKK